MSCVIVGCKSHSSRNENEAEIISFHRFPSDVTTKQKWIEAIARSNWQWKKQHRICSKHFTDDCFINISHKWRRLKLNAVPSLHLHKNERPVNIEVKASVDIPEMPMSVDVSSTSEAASTSSMATRAAILSGQQQSGLTHRESQLQQRIVRLKNICQRRLLKINALRQKTKRLKKKSDDLNSRLMDQAHGLERT